jgi:hypothetical protein
MLARLEQAGALSESLLSRVTGEFLESLIGPDDCAVSSADDDGICCGFQRSRLQQEEILCLSGFCSAAVFQSICLHTGCFTSRENRVGNGPENGLTLCALLHLSEH